MVETADVSDEENKIWEDVNCRIKTRNGHG
jgi:hypothetical protein